MNVFVLCACMFMRCDVTSSVAKTLTLYYEDDNGCSTNASAVDGLSNSVSWLLNADMYENLLEKNWHVGEWVKCLMIKTTTKHVDLQGKHAHEGHNLEEAETTTQPVWRIGNHSSTNCCFHIISLTLRSCLFTTTGRIFDISLFRPSPPCIFGRSGYRCLQILWFATNHEQQDQTTLPCIDMVQTMSFNPCSYIYIDILCHTPPLA